MSTLNKIFVVTVLNRQGASLEFVAKTKRDAQTWINSWRDPKNLSARVHDEFHNELGFKVFGRKTIVWN